MTPSESKTPVPGRASRRRWVALALLALLLGATGWWALRPAPAPEPPAVSLEGLDAAVARSVEQAQAQLRQAPRASGAWGRLGMVLAAHAFRPQAVACFAEAERLDAREPRWPYFRGVMLQLDGFEADAVPALRRAAVLCPADPDAVRLRLADLLVKQGDLDAAEALYRDLLLRDAGHAAAHLGLARIAVDRGDPAEGGRQLADCLDSPFARKSGYLVLAEVRQRLGDPAAAHEAMRQAAALPADAPWPDPFIQEIYELKADTQTLVRRGQGEAEDDPARAATLEVNHPGAAAFAEGHRRLTAGDAHAAELAFRGAVRAEPDFVQAHFWLGSALLQQHDAAGAAAEFRQAIRLQPLHAAAYAKLGQCLEMQGDHAGAIDALRTAVRYQPQRAEAQRQLGELLAHDGRDAEALEHLRQALDVDPEDAPTKALVEQIEKRVAPAVKP